MLIDELEIAYNEFQRLLDKDDVNGKQIIAMLLKIYTIENKLVYQMFYDEVMIYIVDDTIDELCADISCNLSMDILLDPPDGCAVYTDKKTLNNIKRLKNRLNCNFDKFMLNSNKDWSEICYFISKYSNSINNTDYWILKNFLNKKFVSLEEKYEKTKTGSTRTRTSKRKRCKRAIK